eukprot:jgi/Psemu1/288396/fgenesh1_pg.258_\
MPFSVNKRKETAAAEFASGVPSLFASSGVTTRNYQKSIAKINKIGTEKIIGKTKSYGDIDIGDSIVSHNSDLKGFGETLKHVKKEDVAIQPGAMRKHKMMTELSSRPINSYLHKRTGKFKGRNTAVSNANILALVDGAIEDGPTTEAKQKLSAERAAATAPIPATLRKPTKEKAYAHSLQGEKVRSESQRSSRKQETINPNRAKRVSKAKRKIREAKSGTRKVVRDPLLLRGKLAYRNKGKCCRTRLRWNARKQTK